MCMVRGRGTLLHAALTAMRHSILKDSERRGQASSMMNVGKHYAQKLPPDRKNENYLGECTTGGGTVLLRFRAYA